MSRPVPEWIGKTDTTPVPKRVKERIYFAQGGICGCGCGGKLAVAGEAIEYDHTQALILGGENRESNLRALRPGCHKPKTARDVAQKSTEARKRGKHLGIKAPTRNPIPGSKASGWKRKIGGQVVRREGKQ